jgi:Cu/Ag efflux protein CusF
MHTLYAHTGPRNVAVALLVLCGVAVSHGKPQGRKQELGFARIQSLDPEGDKITLVTDSKEKITVSVQKADLRNTKGDQATLSDFKEGQFVRYSWEKTDGIRNSVKLAQAFCKTDGPTLCEAESNKKHCHQKCKDGPCACPL